MRTLTRLGRLLPLLALGTLAAHAQESGLGYDFKLRYGHQVTERKDNLRPGQLGFGFTVAYQTGANRFGVELGYQLKAGSQYAMDVTTFPVDPLSVSTDPNYLSPDPANSGDIRRNELSGFTARLSYQWLPEKAKIGFQGGLQFGGAKFRHEYFGNTADTDWTYTDFYTGTPSKSDIGVSPFVGVVVRVTDHSFAEFNILAQRYKSIDYVHVVGTVPGSYDFNTAKDYLVEESRTSVHLEVGYAFRF